MFICNAATTNSMRRSFTVHLIALSLNVQLSYPMAEPLRLLAIYLQQAWGQTLHHIGLQEKNQ